MWVGYGIVEFGVVSGWEKDELIYFFSIDFGFIYYFGFGLGYCVM